MDLRVMRYFVAVAEERHVGRAATRLHMTQPPLSRAVQQLEKELGATLLQRSPTGVTLTPAGVVLYDEARALLEHADQVQARVATSTGTPLLTLGVLADSAEQLGDPFATAFRELHPDVRVQVREFDLTEPTVGLRAGLVDVALTRTPFDDSGIAVHVLRSDPVGVVLRTDDPLADRQALQVADLDDRTWFRWPDGTDARWAAYWNGTGAGEQPRPGPVVRTVQECLQAVLWNGSIGLTPLVHELPDGLRAVPLPDWPPSSLVVAWVRSEERPVIRSFVRLAVATSRPAPGEGPVPMTGP